MRWSSNKLMYRQGDLLLVEVASLPDDVMSLDHCVIARGVATGHCHEIESPQSAILYQATMYSDDLYIKTVTEAHLVHANHATIILPEYKVFRVLRQRQHGVVDKAREVLD